MAYIKSNLFIDILNAASIRPGVYVETGTYLGDSAASAAEVFDQVFTMELSRDLFIQAARRFHGVSKITVMQGDSASKIGTLTKDLRPIFWYLDAHHFQSRHPVAGEGNFPLWAELEAISLREVSDIVCVDDVHAFGRPGDFAEVCEENIVNALAGSPRMEISTVGDVFVVERLF